MTRGPNRLHHNSYGTLFDVEARVDIRLVGLSTPLVQVSRGQNPPTPPQDGQEDRDSAWWTRPNDSPLHQAEIVDPLLYLHKIEIMKTLFQRVNKKQTHHKFPEGTNRYISVFLGISDTHRKRYRVSNLPNLTRDFGGTIDK